jgi:uncharacterized protein (TIGR03067 family)
MKKELQLLQVIWNIVSLEVDGAKMAEPFFRGSQIVIEGNSFTTVSMGAKYAGTMKVKTTVKPKTFDVLFTQGEHAGKSSLGIYELDGDTWKICMGFAGFDRPQAFVTKAASNHALEILKRDTPEKSQSTGKEPAQLNGEWSMLYCERDGEMLPDMLVSGGERVVKGDQVTVTFGGQLFFRATFTSDPSKKPKAVDYTIVEGPDAGKTQLGIYETSGNTFRICSAAPGKERPTEFTAKEGDGRTFSIWRRAKKE